jgi:hypothetical protein
MPKPYAFHTESQTNFELKFLCDKLGIAVRAVCMCDELPSPLPDGAYIVNLQRHEESGSHWCGLCKSQNTVFYCDSFGCIYTVEEEDLFRKQGYITYMNQQQLQHVRSHMCGYFSVAFLLYMLKEKGSNISKFKRYVKMFDTKNLLANDAVVKNYIEQYL